MAGLGDFRPAIDRRFVRRPYFLAHQRVFRVEKTLQGGVENLFVLERIEIEAGIFPLGVVFPYPICERCQMPSGVMKMRPVWPQQFRRVLFRQAIAGPGSGTRVGGLKPWRLGLVRSLLTPSPFEFVRSPTHHFPSRLGVIRSKKRRTSAENGGLDSVRDCRAIHFKRSCIGDNARVSTHPRRSRTSPVRIAANGNKSRQKKNLPKLDDFHHPRLDLPGNRRRTPRRLLVAGTFGNRIPKRQAIAIGMFPDMPQEDITSIGNAAGEGAILGLFDPKTMDAAQRLAKNVRVFELGPNP